MAFKSDLSFGQRYEEEAIKLEGKGQPVETAPKDKAFSDWDFKVGEECFEVKADRLAHRTGNLCIEYECNNRPSGISVTKATTWCYFVINPAGGYTYYKIPINALRKGCVGARLWHTDAGRTRFYLVPASLFAEYKVNV